MILNERQYQITKEQMEKLNITRIETERQLELCVTTQQKILKGAELSAYISEIQILRGQMQEYEESHKLIDFLWGNPLSLEEYKVSAGLAEEIHHLIGMLGTAHALAASCGCEACRKIEEATRLPVFG